MTAIKPGNGDEVWVCSVPIFEDLHVFMGGHMPEQQAISAALAWKVAAFGYLLTTFTEVMDPIAAVPFALLTYVVLAKV